MQFNNRGREYFPQPDARLLTLGASVNGSATAPALPKEPPAASDGVVNLGISQLASSDPGNSISATSAQPAMWSPGSFFAGLLCAATIAVFVPRRSHRGQ